VLLDWYATAGIVINAYSDPSEEPFWSWTFTTLSCFLNLGAAFAESASWELVIYPVSCLLIACLVLAVVWTRLLRKGAESFLADFLHNQTGSRGSRQDRLFKATCPPFAPIWLPGWAASGDI
jgi:hypothetical protein